MKTSSQSELKKADITKPLNFKIGAETSLCMYFTVLENYHYLKRRKIGIKQCWSSCAKLKPTKSLVNKKVDFRNPVRGGGCGRTFAPQSLQACEDAC